MFKVNDRVKINFTNGSLAGKIGTVERLDQGNPSFTVRVRIDGGSAYWFAERELCGLAEAPVNETPGVRVEIHPHTPETIAEEEAAIRENQRVAKRNEFLFVLNTTLNGMLAGRDRGDQSITEELVDKAARLARIAIRRADEEFKA
jgi:hypothetical protein